MSFAIITEKFPDGRAKNIKYLGEYSPESDEKAKMLDLALKKEVPKIEKELIADSLLEKKVPVSSSPPRSGDVYLWHAVGIKLTELCKQLGISGRRERRWLWEAINNIYATNRIKRKSRGPSRIHFEYCYRLAQFPIGFVSQIKWSEWVFFFDSKTVREELRIDDWLKAILKTGEKIDRRVFRSFTKKLNKRLKDFDTSVLTPGELFDIYDDAWWKAKSEAGKK